MSLLTPEIEKQMFENARDIDGNPRPAVKLFAPYTSATWLLTKLDPEDKDTAFGLCDLGMGFPELGYVSIKEMESVKKFGIPLIERDEYWEAEFPLSVYTAAAQVERQIIDDPAHPTLQRAAKHQL